MLATSGELPPDEDGWAFEIKWDGVRALAYVEDGAVHLESRNLNDITPRYPEVTGIGGTLAGRAALLDGEVVAFDESGRPSFGRLQGRMHLAGERAVSGRMATAPVLYLIFDILHLDDTSLLDQPWTARRAVLESLELDGAAGGSWRVPAAHLADGAALHAATKSQGLEGILAKRQSSLYLPGRRTRDWLKVKNVCRQEFVIGGWLPGAGNRLNRIGALLAGVYDGDDLRFCGKVGTGFTDKELVALSSRLAPLSRSDSPFADHVPYRAARFVEPVLVADVDFTEWTSGGTLRHPSYKGLRDDKAASEVVREPTPGT